MPRCLYKGCSNNTAKKKEILSYHRIPKDEDLMDLWIARIGQNEFKENINPYTGFICSKHFKQTDLIHVSSTTNLKKGALPLQYVQLNQVDLDVVMDESIYSFDDRQYLRIEEQEPLPIPFIGQTIEINNNYRPPPPYEEINLFNVTKEHNYAKPYNFARSIGKLAESRKVYKLRKLIYGLRREVKSAVKKVEKKYKKFKNFDKMTDLVQQFFLIVMKHYNQKSHPSKYTPIIREFALTLHYYSPSGYDFVRDTFHCCLPSCKTIRNWYCSINGESGFSTEALLAIQNLQFETPYPIVGCISVDGMSLRKQLQNNGDRTFGYVDFGGVIPTDKKSMANEALNMMFVGMNVPIKINFGYFLINGIGGQQLTQLTSTGTELLRDAGVIPGTLAYDGYPSNFAMSKNHGCDWKDVTDIKPILSIGDSEYKMFAWPDMPHMIKLLRNALHDLGVFLNENDETIEWKYIVRLFEFQKQIGLHLGNKLRNLHVNYKNQIMKVYLATQVFSTSVADAIEICDQTFKLPDFRGSKATVECLRIINDLFDIFNSFDMNAISYKQPLQSENFDFIMRRLDEAKHFLLNLKDSKGTFMYKSERNTCIIGMLILIESLKGFYDEYVNDKKLLKYVPTYKAGSDNLEIFHCTMRSHSGYNSNPTASQYRSAIKKSRLHVQVRTKKTANCIPLENIPILSVDSTSERRPIVDDFVKDLDDSELTLDGVLSNVLEGHYVNDNHLYEYVNIVAYISGFVARRLTSILKCESCVKALITTDENDPEFIIVLGKQRGGLFLPSRSVREICGLADRTFRYFLKESGGKLLDVEFTIKKMTMVVGKHCSENKSLFEDLEKHFLSSPADLHYYVLIREIATLYLKVRVHYLNKTVSGNDGRRQKKVHEVHFLGM